MYIDAQLWTAIRRGGYQPPARNGLHGLRFPRFLRAFLFGRLIAAPTDVPQQFANKRKDFLAEQ